MKESGQVTQMVGQTAAAPAQAAGDMSQMSSMMTQPMQAAMGAAQPLMGMFQAPMQAFQGLSSMPQSLMGQLGGMFGGMKAGDAAMPAAELVKASSPGGLGGAGAGGGGAAGGFPGAGLTSYTRPTSSFAPENSGRPDILEDRAARHHRAPRPDNLWDGRRHARVTRSCWHARSR